MKVTKASILEQTAAKNLEAIEMYLCADDEERMQLSLTDKQKELMERWNYADDLLRTERYDHHEVAKMIAQKFNVHFSSAKNDIRNAQIVFGTSNALDKRYNSFLQIKRLQKSIRLCIQAQKWKEAAEFEKVLQKAIDSLPDTTQPKTPRTIVFNIQNNNRFEVTDKELKEAEAIANEYLEAEEVDDEQ